MITNQDGLGTNAFEKADFELVQQLLIEILASQGIFWDQVLICPHFPRDDCYCRKPKLALVMPYLRGGVMNFENSYVIGDRETDLQLADNMGIQAIFYDHATDWLEIANRIISKPRYAKVQRVTKETAITVEVNLDESNRCDVDTGLGFFDHMLMQLAKHGGFSLALTAKGDLRVDEHHTVEDTALALGETLRKALGDKLGINRYGYWLPMDEARAEIAMDLSGRSYLIFEGKFPREQVGELPTELISHFFRSFADSLGMTLHIKFFGENTHHMIECIFKGVGRALRQAIQQQGYELPTTKGVL